jgi:hypothetical protein
LDGAGGSNSRTVTASTFRSRRDVPAFAVQPDPAIDTGGTDGESKGDLLVRALASLIGRDDALSHFDRVRPPPCDHPITRRSAGQEIQSVQSRLGSKRVVFVVTLHPFFDEKQRCPRRATSEATVAGRVCGRSSSEQLRAGADRRLQTERRPDQTVAPRLARAVRRGHAHVQVRAQARPPALHEPRRRARRAMARATESPAPNPWFSSPGRNCPRTSILSGRGVVSAIMLPLDQHRRTLGLVGCSGSVSARAVDATLCRI